jgi:hypothetical protein
VSMCLPHTVLSGMGLVAAQALLEGGQLVIDGILRSVESRKLGDLSEQQAFIQFLSSLQIQDSLRNVSLSQIYYSI